MRSIVMGQWLRYSGNRRSCPLLELLQLKREIGGYLNPNAGGTMMCWRVLWKFTFDCFPSFIEIGSKLMSRERMREENLKCTSFSMCLNLNNYQFKASIKFWINVLELHSNHKPKQYIRFTHTKK